MVKLSLSHGLGMKDFLSPWSGPFASSGLFASLTTTASKSLSVKLRMRFGSVKIVQCIQKKSVIWAYGDAVWLSEELPMDFPKISQWRGLSSCIENIFRLSLPYDILWLPWRISVLSGSEEAGIMVRFSSKFPMLCGLVTNFRCIQKYHLLVELARMLFGSVKNCQRCFFQLILWCCMGQRRISDTFEIISQLRRIASAS